MSFDMSQCKIGDKLVCRNGTVAVYEGKFPHPVYNHRLALNGVGIIIVTDKGEIVKGGQTMCDIIGFYKEGDKIIERDIREFLGLEDNLSIKCKLSPNECGIRFENIEECMSKIFKAPETEEQKNLRELKEQYKLLGDKINQLEGK